MTGRRRGRWRAVASVRPALGPASQPRRGPSVGALKVVDIGEDER